MANNWHALLLKLIVLLAAGVLSQPALAVFVQQGSKLVGTGVVGTAHQGRSVALSADGNTAIVGGYLDNSRERHASWPLPHFLRGRVDVPC
jgi:uncharacterized protein YdbL (DUF1318 family)